MIYSYHVYNDTRRQWLDESEHGWTDDFSASASLTTCELATAVAQREIGDDVYYILAWISE